MWTLRENPGKHRRPVRWVAVAAPGLSNGSFRQGGSLRNTKNGVNVCVGPVVSVCHIRCLQRDHTVQQPPKTWGGLKRFTGQCPHDVIPGRAARVHFGPNLQRTGLRLLGLAIVGATRGHVCLSSSSSSSRAPGPWVGKEDQSVRVWFNQCRLW